MRVLICVFTTHIEKLLKQERIRHIRIRITKGLCKVFLNGNELHNEMIMTDNDNLNKFKLFHITVNCHKHTYCTCQCLKQSKNISSENHPFHPFSDEFVLCEVTRMLESVLGRNLFQWISNIALLPWMYSMFTYVD